MALNTSYFGINMDHLEQKIKENHSAGSKNKSKANKIKAARDFARFELHSTSDVIE